MNKERPILFNGEMVRAILDGRKTQTRRVVTNSATASEAVRVLGPFSDGGWDFVLSSDRGHVCYCPYGVPGDRLWVRETWAPVYLDTEQGGDVDAVAYRATNTARLAKLTEPDPGLMPHEPEWTFEGYDRRAMYGGKWKPSIHMPRWASRITLEVTDVRVERVQEISETDAKAEGCDFIVGPTGRVSDSGIEEERPCYRAGFSELWDSINAQRGFGWYTDPWVWAVTFKRVEPADA